MTSNHYSPVKRNRLLLEFRQKELTDRKAKRSFWDKLFGRPVMYIGYSIHRCTSITHAMDFIRNKNMKNIITGYWYDQNGHRHRLIEKGKISLMVKINNAMPR